MSGTTTMNLRVAAGHWLDSLQACSTNVQRHFERSLFTFGKVIRPTLDGVTQPHRRALGYESGFEQHKFVELHALAQSGDIVDDSCRELFVLQPYAGKSVAMREDDQRIKACLLK